MKEQMQLSMVHMRLNATSMATSSGSTSQMLADGSRPQPVQQIADPGTSAQNTEPQRLKRPAVLEQAEQAQLSSPVDVSPGIQPQEKIGQPQPTDSQGGKPSCSGDITRKEDSVSSSSSSVIPRSDPGFCPACHGNFPIAA